MLLLLLACIPSESGIDYSVIRGTVSIPPVAVEEKDGPRDPSNVGTNDDSSVAQALGEDDSPSLTYRTVILSGKVSAWPIDNPRDDDGDKPGDPDWFVFAPVTSGSWWTDLAFTPTGGVPSTAVEIAIYDGSGAVLASEVVDTGSTRLYFDVEAGGEYYLAVTGLRNSDTEAELAYTVVLSGSMPEDGTVLVGGYPEGDPTVASNPVAGTTAESWNYNASTYTWTGTYEMLGVREVVPVADENLEDEVVPSPEVNEDVASMFIMAATMTSLNATPSAGALYSISSVEVTLDQDLVEVGDAVVMDGVFPKVVGLQVDEVEPTVAQLNADYTLILDTVVAQDLGMVSGLGFVDIISGTSDLSGTPDWPNNDGDAFSFTVPESMRVRLTASWDDPGADLDFGIWGPIEPDVYYDYFAGYSDTYCLTGAYPEVCEISNVTLEPDITYYLVALGYSGTGSPAYTIELEWLQP